MESILIANRGEIAMRILRTCREMGLFTVAVYSDADSGTPLTRQADLALRLGAAPPAESYLNVERVLAAARGNGVDAIHPGYGFLAENAAFAESCAAEGINFIGPPPQAIRAMGDKAEAKRLMRAAGVPVIPGYDGPKQDDATLRREAGRVGYPLLVKAVAGGGGRGIRLVENAKELAEAMASARREAASGFGDDRLMLEKYLRRPRHVEFQIMADRHGNVLHLFERECSIQRRHQKVIEEAPSPALNPELRRAMGEAAVQAALVIGYVGAGTVEFLLDADGAFYFLEMNTRLQVEHPITEMTLGLDLVRMQIEVAEGKALGLRQQELSPSGHAIECRLNAESPELGFLPSVGRLGRFDFPSGPGLRVDAGYEEGSRIGHHYDGLLAKLVAWGPTRPEALRKMERMLAGSMVSGVDTNLAFMQAVLAHEAFRAGDYSTSLVEEQEAALIAPPRPPALLRELLLATAAVDAMLETFSAGRTATRNHNGAAPSIWGSAQVGASHSLWGSAHVGASPSLWGSAHVGASPSPWDAARPWAASTGITAAFRRDYTLDGKTHEVVIQPLPLPSPRPSTEPPGDGIPGAVPSAVAGALALRMTWRDTEHHATCIPTAPGEATQFFGDATLHIGEARLPLRWGTEGNTGWGAGGDSGWGAEGDIRWIALRGVHARVTSRNPFHEPAAGEGTEAALQKLHAALPGTVIKVVVKKGQQVAEDDLLMIMEAVKMEHQITAPFAGKVGVIHFKEGDRANKGDLLLDLEPLEA